MKKVKGEFLREKMKQKILCSAKYEVRSLKIESLQSSIYQKHMT